MIEEYVDNLYELKDNLRKFLGHYSNELNMIQFDCLYRASIIVAELLSEVGEGEKNE